MLDAARILHLGLFCSILCITAGCGTTLLDSRFDEARESVPDIRGYALEHLHDLTLAQREIIQTREPGLAQANFTYYYFSWRDDSGKIFATVETSAPPCKPWRAYEPVARE